MYASEATYQSSQTCAASNLQSVFISSPYPAALFAVNVSSPGQGGSFIEIFDGAPSTGDVASGSFPARRVDYINSMLALDQLYNVSFSSWLAVSNQPGPAGGVPACISIIYRVR
jgi:hypothetical protein